MAKVTNPKLEKLDEKMTQLANQRKQIIKREKEKERKAQTRRLIEHGAILEHFLKEPETMTGDAVMEYLKRHLHMYHEPKTPAKAGDSSPQG